MANFRIILGSPFPTSRDSRLVFYLVSVLFVACCRAQYYQNQPPPPPQYTPAQPQYPNPTYQNHPRPHYKHSHSYSSYQYKPYPSSSYYDEEDEDYYYYSYRHKEVVDHKEKYILEWDVDIKERIIMFNITIHNYGWVGVGFSRKGNHDGADLCIGGVREGDGLPYLLDMYSDYNNNVYTDASQDWTLRYAYENEGITLLSIYRALDTCDDFDYPITEDLVHLLWAFGETDYLEYHFNQRGSIRVYFLDPVVEIKESPLELWRVSKEITTQKRGTTYWCTIHQAPILLEKNHIVQMEAYLPTKLDVNHVHHILLWLCVVPPGMVADVIFEPFVLYPGEECYFNDAHVIPVMLCKLMVAGWAIGGQPFKLPYSTGIPLGENTPEYYMLEVHINNPEELELTINYGLDIYYTPELREHDGSFQLIGHDVLGLFIVPPVSLYYEIFGICTPDCTRTMIPEEGVKILSVNLHSHTSGKEMKLHHFRNYTELPWIKKDDNYDNTFQQGRVLYKPRTLLPGDELVVRCTYDNSWTNLTVVSGFSTQEEMCLAIVLLNRRIPYFGCFGQVPGKEFLKYIGVEDYRWNTETQSRQITKPPEKAGEFLQFVLDCEVEWTKHLRYKYQQIFLSSEQIGSCPQVLAPATTTTQLMQGDVLGLGVGVLEGVDQIMNLAFAYGEQAIMGNVVGLPTRTPGPVSFGKYPVFVKGRYHEERYCHRPYSPFENY